MDPGWTTTGARLQPWTGGDPVKGPRAWSGARPEAAGGRGVGLPSCSYHAQVDGAEFSGKEVDRFCYSYNKNRQPRRAAGCQARQKSSLDHDEQFGANWLHQKSSKMTPALRLSHDFWPSKSVYGHGGAYPQRPILNSSPVDFVRYGLMVASTFASAVSSRFAAFTLIQAMTCGSDL